MDLREANFIKLICRGPTCASLRFAEDQAVAVCMCIDGKAS
jgi:hypothetical protein